MDQIHQRRSIIFYDGILLGKMKEVTNMTLGELNEMYQRTQRPFLMKDGQVKGILPKE